MDLEWWRTATIVTAAVGQTLFLLLYATFPWYRTFLGRALFLNAFTLAILIDTATINHLWGWDWGYRDLRTVLVYGLTVSGIWAQLIAFVRQKTIHHHENQEYYRGTGYDQD